MVRRLRRDVRSERSQRSLRSEVWARLFTLAGALLIGAGVSIAACGRSIPKEIRLAMPDAGNITAQGDGAIPGGGDGAISGDPDAMSAIDATPIIDAAGPPDSGDACTELDACCMTLPRQIRPQCEMAVMSADPMQC